MLIELETHNSVHATVQSIKAQALPFNSNSNRESDRNGMNDISIYYDMIYCVKSNTKR